MEISELEIENSCGVNTSNIIYADPGNDPNFVFTNDPNFTTTILYDIEGNVINVNSWTECSHYVRGGWSSNINISTINEEQVFFISTLLVFALTTSLFLYFRKRNKK